MRDIIIDYLRHPNIYIIVLTAIIINVLVLKNAHKLKALNLQMIDDEKDIKNFKLISSVLIWLIVILIITNEIRNKIIDILTFIYLTIIYFLVARIAIIVSNFLIKKIFSLKLPKSKRNKKKIITITGLIQQFMSYIIWFIFIIFLLEMYGINTRGFLTGAGIASIIVAFGAQDYIKGIISGLFLIFGDQIAIGDVVEIDGYTGEVEDIGLIYTRLRNWQGNVKLVNNANIKDIINYSIRNSYAYIKVAVPYDKPLEEMENLINRAVEKVRENLKEIVENISVLGVEDFADNGVIIGIIAETEPMQYLTVERALRKYIKLEFEKENITIPIRQLIVHTEGKHGKDI